MQRQQLKVARLRRRRRSAEEQREEAKATVVAGFVDHAAKQRLAAHAESAEGKVESSIAKLLTCAFWKKVGENTPTRNHFWG